VRADLPLQAEVAAVDVVARAGATVARQPDNATPLGGIGGRAIGGKRGGRVDRTATSFGRAPVVRAEARIVDSSTAPASLQPAPVSPAPAGPRTAVGSAPKTGRRAEVFSFLDNQVSPDDWDELDETDDTYLFWMTARALHTDIEEIADDVRAWRRGIRAARAPAAAATHDLLN
jgi:hypothetical protein